MSFIGSPSFVVINIAPLRVIPSKNKLSVVQAMSLTHHVLTQIKKILTTFYLKTNKDINFIYNIILLHLSGTILYKTQFLQNHHCSPEFKLCDAAAKKSNSKQNTCFQSITILTCRYLMSRLNEDSKIFISAELLFYIACYIIIMILCQYAVTGAKGYILYLPHDRSEPPQHFMSTIRDVE